MHQWDSQRLCTAIVLRSSPERSRVVLFERTLGKYVALCFSPLSAGSCIEYQQNRQLHGITRIQVREVTHVPLTLARSHIIFLHQVLEVCDASLPLESCASDVFASLMWLCTYTHTTISEHYQALFFAKLLTMLGLQTTRHIPCDVCTAAIHAASVDRLDTLFLDSECKERLNIWIYYCLTEHLSAECLRTLTFFKKNRTT